MGEQEVASDKEKGISDFESMNLQPGTRLQFFTHRNHKPVHYVSAVIGMEAQSYLLLKQPREQGSLLTFIDGEKLTVRVFSGTAICTFDTTVIKTFNHPLYCLCIDFPQTIRAKKLRTEMRIKVAMDARIVVGAHTHQVRLSNLSATGCLVIADRALGAVNEPVAIAFALPLMEGEETHPITARATIRNLSEQTGDDVTTVAIGLEFDGLSATDLLLIRNHVYELVLDGRQNIV